MVQGAEFLLGARTDPSFGPCLVFGLGGVNVELMDAVRTLMLPLDDVELDATFAEPKFARVLAGFRGAPACDVDALRAAVHGFARFYLAHRDHMSEVEINPLIVRPAGKLPVAVDLRIIR